MRSSPTPPVTNATAGGPSLWLLAAVISVGQLAVTIYLPSLPFMAEYLGTTQTWVQLVVTVYLATFGLAQLIAGPLSDNLGRRPVLLAGLALYSLASLGAALAPNIQILLIARVFQAFGGCASLVVMRAIIRDTTHGVAAAKANSYLGMSLAVAPALAPIVGGQLETWFDWRASFYFTAITAILVSFVVYFRLAETLPADKRQPAALSGLAGRYLALIKMRVFMGYSLLTSLLSAGFQGYLAAAPIIFIVLFGIPAHLFGWYTIAVPIGFTLGNFLAGRLTPRIGMDRLILLALGFGTLGGTVMLLTTVQGGGLLPTLTLVVIYSIVAGLAFPISLAGALNAVEPRIAGAGAAVGGFMQMFLGSVMTAIVAAISLESAFPIAVLISGSVAAALAVFIILVRPKPIWRG